MKKNDYLRVIGKNHVTPLFNNDSNYKHIDGKWNPNRHLLSGAGKTYTLMRNMMNFMRQKSKEKY